MSETGHAKFEQLYSEAVAQSDELAERMLALVLQPVSRLRAFLGR